MSTDFFSRHQRVALQFSGGRDSTAALYALRPFWDRLSVYHVDTGDQFPETRELVDRVSRDVPLILIETDVPAMREEHGMPTDVLPVDNTAFGQMVSGPRMLLQSRYECCARGLMLPMHQRMLDDGITGIVRGHRDEDYHVAPSRDGQVIDGFEFLYPIQDWTAARVDAFLAENGLPVTPFYAEGMKGMPDCMGCTAWWGEGRFDYMAKHHPQNHAAVAAKMTLILAEVDRLCGVPRNLIRVPERA